MKLQDFRLGWRHLIQQPAYSLVVVMGLAIGIAACLLLLGFVRYSLTYNAQVPDAKNVYVLKQRFNVDPRTPWFEIGPLGLVGVARNNEVVADATGFWQDDSHVVRIGDTLKKANIAFAGAHFADMLGIHAIAGDLHSALEQPNGIALTKDTAQRWFGNTPAVGKSVQLDDHLMSIVAVVPNPPANSTMPYETLAGWNSELISESSKKSLLGMEGIWGKVLLKLKPGSSPAALTDALQQAVDHSPLAGMMPPERSRELGGRSVMDLRLTPLMDTYFDQDVAGAPFSGPRGDLKMVLGLAAVALLILGLAVINYVNLAVIRILRRQREIAMRKLLGASVRQVVQQLLAESMLVSLLATAMGLLLAWLVLPIFSELLDRNLEGLFSIGNIGFCLCAPR